jgi:hypothetical protein
MILINVSKEQLIKVHSVYIGCNICYTVQVSLQWLSQSRSASRILRDTLIYDRIYTSTYKRLMEGPWEHDNEPSSPVKYWEILE